MAKRKVIVATAAVLGVLLLGGLLGQREIQARADGSGKKAEGSHSSADDSMKVGEGMQPATRTRPPKTGDGSDTDIRLTQLLYETEEGNPLKDMGLSDQEVGAVRSLLRRVESDRREYEKAAKEIVVADDAHTLFRVPPDPAGPEKKNQAIEQLHELLGRDRKEQERLLAAALDFLPGGWGSQTLYAEARQGTSRTEYRLRYFDAGAIEEMEQAGVPMEQFRARPVRDDIGISDMGDLFSESSGTKAEVP
ncbi:MAG: hypothetical protein QM755_00185 [Luteolibacter sp.]